MQYAAKAEIDIFDNFMLTKNSKFCLTMTFITRIDSSRQALSESAKVEQKIPILSFYLIWNF